jgi:vitamin B12 transport system substrate-binding protein
MGNLKNSILPYLVIVFSILSIFTYSTVHAEAVNFDESLTIKEDYQKQRIITLAPHIIEMLFNLGVGDRVIATTEHSDFPEAANNIPRIGNYARLKLEKILAYEPNLIIAWRTGNPIDDVERLENLGLEVVYSDPRNLDDVAKELRLLGKLTGTQKKAEILAKQYEFDLKKLRNKFANRTPISVFYELWPNPLTTISNNAWPQQHLNVCGAKNPFEKGMVDYPQVGLEQVVIVRPEVIIQPLSKGEKTPNAVNWLKFNEIPASKHKQIITPSSDKLHRMTPRLLKELEKLCLDIDNSRKYYLEH